jgi:hypothetical protein
MCDRALKPLVDYPAECGGVENIGGPEYFKEGFRLKGHPGASNKVNVYASELLDSLFAQSPSMYTNAEANIPALYGRLTDDQLSAYLLHGYGLSMAYPKLGYTMSARLLLDPVGAKQLSGVLKAVGANSSRLGGMLVECETLQGRGIGKVDLSGEASRRCLPARNDDGIVRINDGDLRRVVTTIIREELAGRTCEFESYGSFWDGRWGWCVNGSHSKVLGRNKPKYKVAEIPGVSRLYRRMFAEAYDKEPLSDWDGTTYVSASEKLEHGKTRAIFACDTMSYFAFEHLLKPVERAWHGRRVVLDPGSQGHCGMVERIEALRKRGSLSVMLDFDDFNSQHSLEAQKIVIDVLCEEVGYDPIKTGRLLRSFDRMHISAEDKMVGVATGTLMSGHRGTTFLNSVLNAAYIRYYVGESTYSQSWAIHVGDDVYMSCPTFETAAAVVTKMGQSPCRLNPIKQSVGTVTAEFLRMAVGTNTAQGYFARSVSSCVSGNWVNEVKLSATEGIQTMVQAAHTLYNRSRGVSFATLLAESCARMGGTSVRLMLPLLEGTCSLGPGPVFVNTGQVNHIELDTQGDDTRLPEGVEWRDLPSEATDRYLSTCLTPAEVFCLENMGLSVKSAMLRSSYSKALIRGTLSTPSLKVKQFVSEVPIGSVKLREALAFKTKPGVLQSSPILQLVKDILTDRELRVLVSIGGGDSSAANIKMEAWGGEATSCVIDGFVSYADARAASTKTAVGVVYSTYPYYM